MKYVVLSPKITYWAFGGCWPVVKETKDFVFYTKTNGEDFWEEKISKKNILFFTETDITKEIKMINTGLWESHRALQTDIKNYQKNVKNTWSVEENKND